MHGAEPETSIDNHQDVHDGMGVEHVKFARPPFLRKPELFSHIYEDPLPSSKGRMRLTA